MSPNSNEKLKEAIYQFCEWFEMLLALLVIIGLVLTFIKTFANAPLYDGLLSGSFPFLDFLEEVFILIIGIEFLQMLCRPNSDNVIEVLIFLVSRHLILQNTNSIHDFLSIMAVCILCIVRRCLHLNKMKYPDKNQDHS